MFLREFVAPKSIARKADGGASSLAVPDTDAALAAAEEAREAEEAQRKADAEFSRSERQRRERAKPAGFCVC